MKANVIEGSISFSLIVLNASELGSIESALEAVCADEIFEFLRQKIMVSKFEVIQESKEVRINVSQTSSELPES
uniref:Uncharacterized protein n=1 Tax=Bacteriophage sp. TaxID=38018 RepID=A0A7G9A4S7_9VIRU|nr:MAG: hypothetical protein [Bacteriophage sp.]